MARLFSTSGQEKGHPQRRGEFAGSSKMVSFRYAIVTALGVEAEAGVAQACHEFVVLQETHVAAAKARALPARLSRCGWTSHLLDAPVTAVRQGGAVAGTRAGFATLA